MNHPKVDTELLQQILAQQIKANELLRAILTELPHRRPLGTGPG
jgi:hypothetical protein